MISFEVFAAKDSVTGALLDILLTVPVNCGLHQADTLRLHGAQLLAIEKGSVLPIDFPPLDLVNQRAMEATLHSAGVIAVAEFCAMGMTDNYLLKLESSTAPSEAGVAEGS